MLTTRSEGVTPGLFLGTVCPELGYCAEDAGILYPVVTVIVPGGDAYKN